MSNSTNVTPLWGRQRSLRVSHKHRQPDPVACPTTNLMITIYHDHYTASIFPTEELQRMCLGVTVSNFASPKREEIKNKHRENNM